jgi:hypothetical protein
MMGQVNWSFHRFAFGARRISALNCKLLMRLQLENPSCNKAARHPRKTGIGTL